MKRFVCVVSILIVLDCFHCLFGQTASFSAPDTVCVNSPVNIINTTSGASNYFWNFCVADILSTPTGDNLGNPNNNFSGPTFMDYVQVNNNYYGFATNYTSGELIRLDFGNSLLNTPTSVNLGNFGGILQTGSAAEGIQMVFNEGKWYAIIVGGNTLAGTQPRIVKIEFGTDITNTSPVAVNWGNIGNMQQPIDLHVFKENNNWYGFTVNSEANTIVRFNFSNSFDNTPTADNLGNLGGLAYPTGIYAINDNGFWRVFIVNGGDNQRIGANSSLTRLDFGNSLLNTPTGVNLGNSNNGLVHPRDLTILKFCGQVVGFAVNGNPGSNNIVRLDFNNNLAATPVISTVGNIGNMNFPHSISKLFRVNADIFAFITNVANNTMSRIRFEGCTNASIPNSTLKDPPPISYSVPGTYNINLTIDDGLPTQSSFCKQVVVAQIPTADFSFTQDPCTPTAIRFKEESVGATSISWDFGNGVSAGNDPAPQINYAALGTYDVKLTAISSATCKREVIKQLPIQVNKSNVITTPNTVLCAPGGTVQLNAVPALSYCWTPSAGLSNTTIANPIATVTAPRTYYLNAQTAGGNLVTNGNFSQGNTGFQSDYNYAAINVTEGQYFVGTDPSAWNPSLSPCSDHTGGNGNMMLVNGSPVADVKVWTQTITVQPNTNYAFSTWIQALWPPNPAQLSFAINGADIGAPITASLPTCTLTQFYAIWNSGANTSATISIVNKNTQVIGNDFALDDISFAPLLIERDSVVIDIETPGINTNGDTTICSDQPVPLQATGGATYQWKPAAGLSDAAIANPVATPDVTTEYIVTGLTANGCKDTDTLTITVMQKPVILNEHDTSICPGEPVQLAANSSLLSFNWSPAASLNDASIYNPLATPNSPTLYTVTVEDGNHCIYKDSVDVQIRTIEFAVSPNETICQGSTHTFQASGADTYTWTPGESLDDASAATPVAMPPTTTTYSVYMLENTCGHDTTITRTISVNPAPTVTVRKTNDINCTSPSTILDAQGALQYLWSPAAAVDFPNRPHVQAGVDTTTIFYVTGMNEYGCSHTASIQVNATVAGAVTFVVPNAFTPNGDGHNDCISIKKWGSAAIEEFSIFTRYGERVFSTNAPSKCWDGRYKGKVMNEGGYAYIIKARTLCGPIKRTGMIMLIK